MKRIIYLLSIALVALVSCNKTDDSSTSLDGRWNAPRFADQPDDYAFSLIFKGNKLDAYIIAWGEHFEGTYTFADDVLKYNITKAYNAWSDVAFDDKGNMISWSWMAGDMDQETFKLIDGYDWYDMTSEDLADRKSILSEFSFKVRGNTAVAGELFGIDGLTFYKVK